MIRFADETAVVSLLGNGGSRKVRSEIERGSLSLNDLGHTGVRSFVVFVTKFALKCA